MTASRYVHAKGVRHGEVDDRNIFIGDSIGGPVAKIADFGEPELLPEDANERDRAHVKEHYSCLTPVVAIVTDNAIKSGSQLTPESIAITACSVEAKAFLDAIRAFFKLWGDKHAYLGQSEPAPFVNLIDNIRKMRG